MLTAELACIMSYILIEPAQTGTEINLIEILAVNHLHEHTLIEKI